MKIMKIRTFVKLGVDVTVGACFPSVKMRLLPITSGLVELLFSFFSKKPDFPSTLTLALYSCLVGRLQPEAHAFRRRLMNEAVLIALDSVEAIDHRDSAHGHPVLVSLAVMMDFADEDQPLVLEFNQGGGQELVVKLMQSVKPINADVWEELAKAVKSTWTL